MQRAIIFAVTAAVAAATAAYADPAASPTPTNSALAKSADPRDRIICRSSTEIGTLARIVRTCKTRREWDADAAAIRAAGTSSQTCRNAETGQC